MRCRGKLRGGGERLVLEWEGLVLGIALLVDSPGGPLGLNLVLLPHHIGGHVHAITRAEEAHLVARERLEDVVSEQMLSLLEIVCPAVRGTMPTHHMAAPMRFEMER